jgi:hypothetical protein
MRKELNPLRWIRKNMDIVSDKRSPYASFTPRDQNRRAVDLAVETLVDFLLHSLLRIKRKRLKLEVAPELVAVYKKLAEPTWQKIEQIRRRELRAQYRAKLLGGLATLASCVLLFFIGPLPLLLSALLTTVFVLKPTVRFKQAFVASLAPELLYHLPNFHYQHYGYIDMAELANSHIVPAHAPELIEQEDYFRYEGAAVTVELVECSLAKYRSKKGERERSTVFTGIVARARLSQDTGAVAVMHCNWGKLMSWMQEKPLEAKYKLAIENSPLGARYDFYAKDAAFARRVFSVPLLNQIAELIELLDVAAPEISISGQQIVLLLHRPKNLFNAPGLSAAGLREEVLTEMLQETLLLERLCTIVDTLAANTPFDVDQNVGAALTEA